MDMTEALCPARLGSKTDATKRIMGALVRQPLLKPHEEMNLGKLRGKKATSLTNRKAKRCG
jgi:hypothetical protein